MTGLRSVLRSQQVGCFALFIGAAVVCGIVGFPFYWMLVSSMQSGALLFSYPPSFWPNGFAFASYRLIFLNTELAIWMWNSLVVATLSTLLAVAVGTSGAFALSRFRYRGKQVLILTVLTTQMMPPLVLIIPLFMIFLRFDMIDTLAGLVFANFAFGLPVVTWMMKAIFDSIPLEIEEAARIDGASWMTILIRITGPLALPGLVATSIFCFIQAWDEFLMARTIVTATDKWVASVGLSSFIGVYVTPWDQIMAAAVVFTLPPVLLFLVIQKYFVAGLSTGAVKG